MNAITRRQVKSVATDFSQATASDEVEFVEESLIDRPRRYWIGSVFEMLRGVLPPLMRELSATRADP